MAVLNEGNPKKNPTNLKQAQFTPRIVLGVSRSSRIYRYTSTRGSPVVINPWSLNDAFAISVNAMRERNADESRELS